MSFGVVYRMIFGRRGVPPFVQMSERVSPLSLNFLMRFGAGYETLAMARALAR
jgi:hypothetical protein